jgi:hypothetical protein
MGYGGSPMRVYNFLSPTDHPNTPICKHLHCTHANVSIDDMFSDYQNITLYFLYEGCSAVFVGMHTIFFSGADSATKIK